MFSPLTFVCFLLINFYCLLVTNLFYQISSKKLTCVQSWGDIRVCVPICMFCWSILTSRFYTHTVVACVLVLGNNWKWQPARSDVKFLLCLRGLDSDQWWIQCSPFLELKDCLTSLGNGFPEKAVKPQMVHGTDCVFVSVAHESLFTCPFCFFNFTGVCLKLKFLECWFSSLLHT